GSQKLPLLFYLFYAIKAVPCSSQGGPPFFLELPVTTRLYHHVISFIKLKKSVFIKTVTPNL
ncbi:hypothetical protein, partial [Alteromonas macleodii]